MLKLKAYGQYCEQFKKVFKENVKVTTDNDKKNNDALLNIVKTLYRDASRDKLFLQRENIITDGWEDIDLKCDLVTATDLKNEFGKSKFYF